MGRLIVLDATPLGEAAKPRGKESGDIARAWIARLTAGGAWVCVPEVADYEVRRKLLHSGATAGIDRLDELRSRLRYLPITTAAMLRAAELRAHVRRAGMPTAGPDSLDADAILAGQALTADRRWKQVVIATANVGHLSRFPGVHAESWLNIT